MIQVLIILIITAGLLVWGRIRSDVVALCSMVALVLSGVITPEEGLAGFSNSVVIMIAGLFIIGGGHHPDRSRPTDQQQGSLPGRGE